MVDMPPLHGREFGGELNGVVWLGKFDFLPDANRWAFIFLDEYEMPVSELIGHGQTPLEAFESCVSKFIHLNDGNESPTLKAILPRLRQYFNDDGGVKLEHLLG